GARRCGVNQSAVAVFENGRNLDIVPVDIEKCTAHPQLLFKEITMRAQFIVNDGVWRVGKILSDINRYQIGASAAKALGRGEINALHFIYFDFGAELAQYIVVFVVAVK